MAVFVIKCVPGDVLVLVTSGSTCGAPPRIVLSGITLKFGGACWPVVFIAEKKKEFFYLRPFGDIAFGYFVAWVVAFAAFVAVALA